MTKNKHASALGKLGAGKKKTMTAGAMLARRSNIKLAQLARASKAENAGAK